MILPEVDIAPEADISPRNNDACSHAKSMALSYRIRESSECVNPLEYGVGRRHMIRTTALIAIAIAVLLTIGGAIGYVISLH
jgi:hypothetical protein